MKKSTKKVPKLQSDFFDDTFNIRNCSFGFECKQDWNTLVESNDEDIKYCKKCEKNVYMIHNDNELMTAIICNKCVAVKIPTKPSITVGMINPPDLDKPTFLRNKK